MRTYDFTPLFRSSVGFDRWSDLLDAASRADDSAAGYPPYNIEKTGDDKPTSRSPRRRTYSSSAAS